MHRPRLIHVRGVALLVVILAVAGCTNPFSTKTPPAPASQDRSGRLLNHGETQSALPSVASLPVGWSPAKNILRPKYTKQTVTPARCQPLSHGLDLGYLQAKTKSYTTYINPKRAALGVGIGSHAEAPPGFAGVRTALRSCKTFQIHIANTAVTKVAVRPLRLPDLAPDALVARFAMQSQGVTATYDVVRIRVGHNMILADLVTPGAGKPNTKPLVTAAKNALLNLS